MVCGSTTSPSDLNGALDLSIPRTFSGLGMLLAQCENYLLSVVSISQRRYVRVRIMILFICYNESSRGHD